MNTVQEKNYLNDIHRIAKNIERIAKYMEKLTTSESPAQPEEPSIGEMMENVEPIPTQYRRI